MTPIQRSEHWELHRTEDRLHEAEAARDRYRLAARALAKCVRDECPPDVGIAEYAETWGGVPFGEMPSAEELEALRELEADLK